MAISQKTRIYLMLLMLTGLVACSKINEKELLLLQVDKLVNAIESHDKKEIKALLANNFSAGNDLNKTRFDVFLQFHLTRNKKISILRSNENIELRDSAADVTAEVLLLGASDWIPERGQRYIVESRWVKENNNWTMSRLRWQVKDL